MCAHVCSVFRDTRRDRYGRCHSCCSAYNRHQEQKYAHPIISVCMSVGLRRRTLPSVSSLENRFFSITELLNFRAGSRAGSLSLPAPTHSLHFNISCSSFHLSLFPSQAQQRATKLPRRKVRTRTNSKHLSAPREVSGKHTYTRRRLLPARGCLIRWFVCLLVEGRRERSVLFAHT